MRARFLRRVPFEQFSHCCSLRWKLPVRHAHLVGLLIGNIQHDPSAGIGKTMKSVSSLGTHFTCVVCPYDVQATVALTAIDTKANLCQFQCFVFSVKLSKHRFTNTFDGLVQVGSCLACGLSFVLTTIVKYRFCAGSM